jgi:short-subunit dehydrogenase
LFNLDKGTMGYWQGKTALVTGGSSGLGLAIAEKLAHSCVNVAIVGRDAQRLDAAAAKLRAAAAGDVLTISADVTHPDDVKQMFDVVTARFGKLDLLVNCAGSSARGDVQSTTVDDFRRLMELNFFALVECTRVALPHLLESQGHLVNVGSLASKSASRFMGGYAASKFAVAAYSQQLRLELADRGLHVLLVCPGPIRRDEPRVYEGSEQLPESARQPGAGVKVGKIDPDGLAARILRACERREVEIVVPWKARLLFAISQLSPSCGDWLLKKLT